MSAQPKHFPDPQAIGASAHIHARVAHRVATLTLRADLLVWVQSGSKTVHHARGSYRCVAGQLLMLAKGSLWDVVNHPALRSRYQACALQI